MKVFHGGDKYITQIEIVELNIDRSLNGIGMYFTPDQYVAKAYGSYVTSLDIVPSNFIPFNAKISQYISKELLLKFFKAILLENEEIWYYLSDFNPRITDLDKITDFSILEAISILSIDQIRNFQITIVEQVGMRLFIKLWKEIIQIQGTYDKVNDYYMVLYSNNNLIKETISFFNSSIKAKEWLQ